MDVGFAELPMPLHVRAASQIADQELMRFCAENELLRVERDANGELILMSPSGTESGGIELEIGAELREWALRDGRGKLTAQTPASNCRIAPFVPQTRIGLVGIA